VNLLRVAVFAPLHGGSSRDALMFSAKPSANARTGALSVERRRGASVNSRYRGASATDSVVRNLGARSRAGTAISPTVAGNFSGGTRLAEGSMRWDAGGRRDDLGQRPGLVVLCPHGGMGPDGPTKKGPSALERGAG